MCKDQGNEYWVGLWTQGPTGSWTWVRIPFSYLFVPKNLHSGSQPLYPPLISHLISGCSREESMASNEEVLLNWWQLFQPILISSVEGNLERGSAETCQPPTLSTPLSVWFWSGVIRAAYHSIHCNEYVFYILNKGENPNIIRTTDIALMFYSSNWRQYWS